jgi:hypothetical protein
LILGEPHLLVPPTEEQSLTERATQKVERTAQRGPSVLAVELRPEQREQGVAAVEAPGRSEREIGEEGEPLRLLEHWPKLPAIGSAQIQHAQCAKLDHRFAT